MQKNILVIGTILLFIFSAMFPLVLSNSIRISDEDEQISSLHDKGLMDSAWPMFHHDVRHTGRSPYGKNGNWFVEKWKVDIGSMVFSSPAIDKDGTTYIGSNNRYLYAINSNGTEKWRFKTGGGVSSSPAIAADGTIYVGSEDYNLYAIYPNGTKKWSLVIGKSWVDSSPVIDNDGNIYVASVDGYNICAVYPNGTKKWDFVTGNMVYSSPTLDNNGTVYCGSHDGYMYAIYASNGTLKWKFYTGRWCGGAGAAIGDDGIIYFGTVGESFIDASLYALYPNGTLKWRLELGSNVYSSPAISEDNTIYVAAYKELWGAYMYSISPEGSINWKYELDAEAMSASPTIDKYGIIYIGGWDGILYAFNPDGTIRWKYQTLDEIFPSAAIGENGTIYVGADSYSFTAYLYAIEPVYYNNAPDKPNISGPRKGMINTDYNYSAVTTDADGDNVSYYFDWGDGTNSGWTSYVPSGTSVSLVHSWQKSGFFVIKVKAKDDYGKESDWGILIVKMPKDKTVNFNYLLLKLLERFPMLKEVLSRLVIR
jgi:outer membrane protein assembly factor BamB